MARAIDPDRRKRRLDVIKRSAKVNRPPVVLANLWPTGVNR
jgi:hypothetical protein